MELPSLRKHSLEQFRVPAQMSDSLRTGVPLHKIYRLFVYLRKPSRATIQFSAQWVSISNGHCLNLSTILVGIWIPIRDSPLSCHIHLDKEGDRYCFRFCKFKFKILFTVRKMLFFQNNNKRVFGWPWVWNLYDKKQQLAQNQKLYFIAVPASPDNFHLKKKLSM